MSELSNKFKEMFLVDLELNRVDLVKEGSNSRAHILLTKGKEQNSMPKTYDELVALLKPEEAEILKSHVEAIEKTAEETLATKDEKITVLEAEVAKLSTEKEEYVAELEKSKADTEEEIMKNVPPAMVEMIEKMRKENEELKAREQDIIVKARFEEVKAIPCTEDDLKAVLKTATPDVFEVLKKAAATIENSVLKDTSGSQGGDGNESSGGAFEKLEKAARTRMAENDKLTYEQAFTEVTKAMPEVYAAYSKEV